jgi:hypothetical protein
MSYIMATMRMRRRILAAIVIASALLIGTVEISVRVVLPEAVEVQVYTEMGNQLIGDQTINNPVVSQGLYRDITAYPQTYISPMDSLHCSGGPLDDPTGHIYVLRFLWHGIPIAVVTHRIDNTNSWLSPFYSCGQKVRWWVSSGGIANPFPYINDQIFQSPAFSSVSW